MTNKIPKHAFQILLGIMILSFSVAACNNDGEKKEEAPVETPKMAEPPKMDPVKVDTPLLKKPTDSGN